MNANDELERRIADFYATETPPRAPDWVLESALTTIDTTPQRRALIRLPRRFQTMNTFTKVAVAAVAVIAIGGVGLAVLRPGQAPPGIGGPGSPSSSPAGSPFLPSASLTQYPALTGTFTSSIHGISTAYPSGWTVTEALQPWRSGIPAQCDPQCSDRIVEKNFDSPFLGLSSQPLAGLTGDAWLAKLLSEPGLGNTCAPQTEAVTIDGNPGQINVLCPEGLLTAETWTEDRGYFIVLYRIDDVAWFKDILATVRLHPEDAVDTTPSLSPSS
jgi:hypothetical protein